MKRTFSYSVEWSDFSENSPTKAGQFPDAVVLPDGERVDLSGDLVEIARWNQGASRAGYVQIHANVRVRQSFWGDDTSRRTGRAGGKTEVLAPKGSAFKFAIICPYCGEENGETGEAGLEQNGHAPACYHPACQILADRIEAIVHQQIADGAEESGQ